MSQWKKKGATQADIKGAGEAVEEKGCHTGNGKGATQAEKGASQTQRVSVTTHPKIGMDEMMTQDRTSLGAFPGHDRGCSSSR